MRIGVIRAAALIVAAVFPLLMVSEASAKHRRAHRRHWDGHYRVRIYDDRNWRPVYVPAPRAVYIQPVRPSYDGYYDSRWDDRDGWRFRDDWRSGPAISGSIQINP